MVPAGLPRPAFWVILTGVLEALGAVGLLVGATATVAGWCLAALLVLMFPANVYAALRGSDEMSVTPLGPRTVQQILFVTCAVLATQ